MDELTGKAIEIKWTEKSSQDNKPENGFAEDISNYCSNDCIKEFEYWYKRFGSSVCLHEIDYRYNESSPRVYFSCLGVYTDANYLFQAVRNWIFSKGKDNNLSDPAEYKECFQMRMSDTNLVITLKDKESNKIKCNLYIEMADLNQAKTDFRAVHVIDLSNIEIISKCFS